MDLLKMRKLPKILRKRKGRLGGIKRSQEELSSYEFEQIKKEFLLFDTDTKNAIQKHELRPL
jgi:Ca2+-binding EF-hand superfamily protein